FPRSFTGFYCLVKLASLGIGRGQRADELRIPEFIQFAGLLGKFHGLGSIAQPGNRGCRPYPGQVIKSSRVGRVEAQSDLVLLDGFFALALAGEGAAQAEMDQIAERVARQGSMELSDGVVEMAHAGQGATQIAVTFGEIRIE